jgi:hypothetical protein
LPWIAARVFASDMLRATASLPLLVLLAASTTASAGESLATPMTGPRLDALWPIQIEVEIVRLTGDSAKSVLPLHVATVPDGHDMKLSSVVDTDKGRREFAIDVIAHHHPGGMVELEWSLEVHEARFRPIGISGYLLHRLQLADALELGDLDLKIARADIVSVASEPLHDVVEIDGERHEIRIFARSVRG